MLYATPADVDSSCRQHIERVETMRKKPQAGDLAVEQHCDNQGNRCTADATAKPEK